MSRSHPLIIESKPASKAGGYFLVVLGCLVTVAVVRWSGNQPQVPTGALVCGLLAGLALLVGPLWYLARNRRYRLALTPQQLQLWQLPNTLVAEHSMSMLIGWWRVQGSFQGVSIDALHLNFKHGARIQINRPDYVEYEQAVGFMQRHFHHKQLRN